MSIISLRAKNFPSPQNDNINKHCNKQLLLILISTLNLISWPSRRRDYPCYEKVWYYSSIEFWIHPPTGPEPDPDGTGLTLSTLLLNIWDFPPPGLSHDCQCGPPCLLLARQTGSVRGQPIGLTAAIVAKAARGRAHPSSSAIYSSVVITYASESYVETYDESFDIASIVSSLSFSKSDSKEHRGDISGAARPQNGGDVPREFATSTPKSYRQKRDRTDSPLQPDPSNHFLSKLHPWAHQIKLQSFTVPPRERRVTRKS